MSRIHVVVLLALGVSFFPTTTSAQPVVTWGVQFGTAQYDTASDVATDRAGGVYVTGSTAGSLDELPPVDRRNVGRERLLSLRTGRARRSTRLSEDAYLRKYDVNGICLWSRQFSSAGKNDDWAYALAIHEQDGCSAIYVTGATMGTMAKARGNAGGSDGWLAKFDASGDQIWIVQFGSTGYEEPQGVATDGNGYVYVTGSYTETEDKQDVWLAKFSPQGIQEWTRAFGTPGTEEPWNIATDAAGYIYLVGYTDGIMDCQSGNAGEDDVWIAKYDPAGDRVWLRQFGSPTLDWGYGLAVSGTDLFITGSTDGVLNPGQSNSGADDSWLAKYDLDGSRKWLMQFGEASSDWGIDVCADGAGGAYVTGIANYNYRTAVGGAWVASYDSHGGRRWIHRIGSSDLVYSSAVVASGSERIYVVGETRGDLYQDNAGASDAFLASLAPHEPQKRTKDPADK